MDLLLLSFVKFFYSLELIWKYLRDLRNVRRFIVIENGFVFLEKDLKGYINFVLQKK